MDSIFKEPEFMTTVTGTLLIMVLTSIIANEYGVTFSIFFANTWKVFLFGVFSFALMGLLIRLIYKIHSKMNRIMFVVLFFIISLYWTFGLFILLLASKP